jgi:hypothetical protein
MQLPIFAVSSGILKGACIFPPIYGSSKLPTRQFKLSNSSVSKEHPQLRHFAAILYPELSPASSTPDATSCRPITLRIGGFRKIPSSYGYFRVQMVCSPITSMRGVAPTLNRRADLPYPDKM